MSDAFTICEIRGAEAWRTVYEGPVRDGTFGTLRDGASEPVADRYWQGYLEESGRADCIFMFLKPKPPP